MKIVSPAACSTSSMPAAAKLALTSSLHVSQLTLESCRSAATMRGRKEGVHDGGKRYHRFEPWTCVEIE